ncbi:hypothetical protein ATANTOWER_005054 [Ataeniobius toweri]|uniref:Uncharacterized protein n=1 Tax=Ataeniobius toweri TaxID=208326 RepID=A0ABU7ADB5_9TELE|nr:hypothetical protein [Ataeniobius toweri]
MALKLKNKQKPSDSRGQKHRRSPGSSCFSMFSDLSKEAPPDLSNEHGPSDPEGQNHRQSPGSRCSSMKSDFSKDAPPDFSTEHGPPDPKRTHHSFSTFPESKSQTLLEWTAVVTESSLKSLAPTQGQV